MEPDVIGGVVTAVESLAVGCGLPRYADVNRVTEIGVSFEGPADVSYLSA